MSFRKLFNVILIGVLVCTSQAQAESPTPFPDFQAKRIKPPKTGEKNRIKVQIPPRPNPAVLPPPRKNTIKTDDKPATKLAPEQPYVWFWDKVPSTVGDANPAHIDHALRVVRGSAEISPPRLDDLRSILQRYKMAILLGSTGTEVSPALALAVIYVESGGHAAASSSAGAKGLMQLMPATADRMGVTDVLDPVQNIRGGIGYLDILMKQFKGDPILATAAYNAGENAVIREGGVPAYPETLGYVPKVIAAYSVARVLCKTPPLFASDGCAFID